MNTTGNKWVKIPLTSPGIVLNRCANVVTPSGRPLGKALPRRLAEPNVVRRTKFAAAAEEWFRRSAGETTVSSAILWEGLSEARPDLTTPSDGRKTPKATCMRDLREDSAFEVAAGKITLKRLS